MINGNVSHWWTDLGTPVPRPGVEGDLDVDVAQVVQVGIADLDSRHVL